MNDMTKEVFEQTLRDLVRRDPVRPFVVELVNGTRIEIDDPKAVAFADGAAGFLSSSFELIPFSCEDVRAIRASAQETIP
jgi:hypothetical protein